MPRRWPARARRTWSRSRWRPRWARALRSTLDATPPELVDDIMERGLVVCGGGALLSGLDRLFAHETLMPVRIAEDPLTCVVRGTGIVLEEIDTLNRVLLRTRRVRALRY